MRAWFQSYRNGPDTGEDIHSWRLGGCLLITYVPWGVVRVSTPACLKKPVSVVFFLWEEGEGDAVFDVDVFALLGQDLEAHEDAFECAFGDAFV